MIHLPVSYVLLIHITRRPTPQSVWSVLQIHLPTLLAPQTAHSASVSISIAHSVSVSISILTRKNHTWSVRGKDVPESCIGSRLGWICGGAHKHPTANTCKPPVLAITAQHTAQGRYQLSLGIEGLLILNTPFPKGIPHNTASKTLHGQHGMMIEIEQSTYLQNFFHLAGPIDMIISSLWQDLVIIVTNYPTRITVLYSLKISFVSSFQTLFHSKALLIYSRIVISELIVLACELHFNFSDRTTWTVL